MKKSKLIKRIWNDLLEATAVAEALAKKLEEINTENKALKACMSDLEDENAALKAHVEELKDSHNCLRLMCEVQRESMKSTKCVAYKQIIQSKEDGRTIILWKDGGKTEVKCSKKDKFNPMTGVALGYLKKLLSPKNYHRMFVDGKIEITDRDKIHKDREDAKKTTKKNADKENKKNEE